MTTSNNTNRRTWRIGVPRTLVGASMALRAIDQRLRRNGDDERLRAIERQLIGAKQFWTKLDAAFAPELAESMSRARHHIVLVLRELRREWQEQRRPGDLDGFIEKGIRQQRFVDELECAAEELATLDNSINATNPKMRERQVSVWTFQRIRVAASDPDVVELLLPSPVRGKVGPKAAAEEVIAKVLGRSRNAVFGFIQRHGR